MTAVQERRITHIIVIMYSVDLLRLINRSQSLSKMVLPYLDTVNQLIFADTLFRILPFQVYFADI